MKDSSIQNIQQHPLYERVLQDILESNIDLALMRVAEERAGGYEIKAEAIYVVLRIQMLEKSPQ